MTLKEFHRQAMDFADEAFVEKTKGRIDEAVSLFAQALELESNAAYLARKEEVGEPSISVLFRSAATLALNAGQSKRAERLAAEGLTGNPPAEIAEELCDLLDTINFERHLRLRGVDLDEAEVQVVVAGKGVSKGMARSSDVIDRIDAFEQLSFRTLERQMDKPFRSNGRITKNIKNALQYYISTPRDGSFAFTLRFGQALDQMEIPGYQQSTSVIDEVLANIALINSASEEDLKKKIPDEAYLRNFIALAKELAPDGDIIKLVGFTVIRNGKERRVEFTRPRENFSVAIEAREVSVGSTGLNNGYAELVGRLAAADSEQNVMRLTTEAGKKYNIEVPAGLGDIVRKYWEEVVRIKGTWVNDKRIKLSDLDPEP